MGSEQDVLSPTQRFVVYHTSDIHARPDFGARLAALVEPGALLVDSGDALAGSSVFYRAREPVVKQLAMAPYAAQAVGNREFHYVHRLFLARARKLVAPLVCSNLIDLRGRERIFARELVLQSQGVRVRILSLLVPQYRTGSGWEAIFGWRFLSANAALQELFNAQMPNDCLTIVLSHLGLAADEAVAQRWSQITAILGGHTHDALEQPRFVNGIPIAHCGAFARFVGKLELAVNNGKTHLVSYALLPLLSAGSSG